MTFLDDVREDYASREVSNRCRFDLLLHQDPELAADLATAVGEKIPYNVLGRRLKANGSDITVSVLRRHFQAGCKCPIS